MAKTTIAYKMILEKRDISAQELGKISLAPHPVESIGSLRKNLSVANVLSRQQVDCW